MKRIAMVQVRSKKTDQIASQPALRGYRHNLEDRMSAASTIESSQIELSFFFETQRHIDLWMNNEQCRVMNDV